MRRRLSVPVVASVLLSFCPIAILTGNELPALGYHPDGDELAWTASWIWLAGEDFTVDVHLQARKEFELSVLPNHADLRITAYSDYVVYINGQRVGRGPEWNDPEYQTYDVYDARAFLRTGKNAIAIVAHNFAIGTHWSRRNRGGLLAQLNMDQGRVIGTGPDWKIRRAEGWTQNNPRIFWSAGFLETFDFRRDQTGWSNPSFDDSSWKTPEVLGVPPVRPWIRLLRRRIPLLEEKLITAVGVEKGASTMPPFHAVRFDQVLAPGHAGIVYAQTNLPSKEERDLRFRVLCDDAFRLFLNGEPVASFGYDEYFARTRLWNGKDEYDQAHYGMGTVQYGAGRDRPEYGESPGGTLHLRKGANRLMIAVDHGSGGWGFLLGFFNSVTRTPIDVDFGGEGTEHLTWKIAGPYESSGLNNSLDRVETSLSAAELKSGVNYSPFDYTRVTDYAALMDAEVRKGRSIGADTVHLNKGEYAIFDLAKIRVGFPEFQIEAQDGDVLDVGYTEVLTPDRRVRLAAYGSMRYVDRIVLKRGTQTWQPFDRRTARYLHVACRQGRGVKVHANGIYAIGYPVELSASFQSSDPQLNRIWETSVYTTRLLMQQGYQDCLKREQGTLNTSSFNYTSKAAAYTFGDYALARKSIVQALRTQDKTGWFDSHGISSPNSDEPTECLWWIVWLKDFYEQSGDLEFVRELFDGLEDNLRYFAKGINHFGLLEGGNRPIAWRGQGIYIDDSAETGKYDGLFDGELVGMNQLYGAALESAGVLARALNRQDRAEIYEKYAMRVKESLASRFWDKDKRLFRDWRLGDELAKTYHPIFQITSLYFDQTTPDQSNRLLHYLTDELGFPNESRTDYPLTTFGYYHYFLDVLFRAGLDAQALTLMRCVYGRWLDLGATTFGEFFRPADWKGKTMLDTEYEVHAYGAGALAHFYSNILGIRPATPGFEKVSINPHPGDLKWARGTASTPKGIAKVSWQTDGAAFRLDAQLPAGCPFEVHAPKGFRSYSFNVNGKAVSSVD